MSDENMEVVPNQLGPEFQNILEFILDKTTYSKKIDTSNISQVVINYDNVGQDFQNQIVSFEKAAHEQKFEDKQTNLVYGENNVPVKRLNQEELIKQLQTQNEEKFFDFAILILDLFNENGKIAIQSSDLELFNAYLVSNSFIMDFERKNIEIFFPFVKNLRKLLCVGLIDKENYDKISSDLTFLRKDIGKNTYNSKGLIFKKFIFGIYQLPQQQ